MPGSQNTSGANDDARISNDLPDRTTFRVSLCRHFLIRLTQIAAQQARQS
jgi:hypothetical protein